MPKLNADELAVALGSLTGWSERDGAIHRTFEFDSYLDGLEFARALGQEAERRDHHPDMLITWRKVDVGLSTHSEGGITEKDVDLARFANSL
jgi:4a-hydroxytetrahydrobiopterin dehydratase